MKKYSYYIVLAAALLSVLYACKKKVEWKSTYDTVSDKAMLRIVHASPHFKDVVGQKDSFNVYVGGVRVTTPSLTYNSIFPNSNTNTYIAVEPGTKEIRLSIPGTVNNPDSLTILTLTKTMLAGQKYTFLITDSVKSTRDSSQIWVNDVFSNPNPNFYGLRFINAVLNDTAGTMVDIYSVRKNSTIFTKVKPGAFVNFQNLPYNPQLNDTLYVRRAGTTFNLAPAAVLGAANQRAYTIIYKGDGDLATGTKGRSLTGYVH
jgi:Domain of unknown function (DUF4397)